MPFLQKSVANRMLDLIRYFEQSLSKESGYDEQKPAFSWGTVEKETVAKTFLSLCTRVQDKLATEARLVEMEAPVYILGQLLIFHPELSHVTCEMTLSPLSPTHTCAHTHIQVTFMAISRTLFALRKCCGGWAPSSLRPLSSSSGTTLTGDHMALRYPQYSTPWHDMAQCVRVAKLQQV